MTHDMIKILGLQPAPDRGCTIQLQRFTEACCKGYQYTAASPPPMVPMHPPLRQFNVDVESYGIFVEFLLPRNVYMIYRRRGIASKSFALDHPHLSASLKTSCSTS
jgi:hypothetical protein